MSVRLILSAVSVGVLFVVASFLGSYYEAELRSFMYLHGMWGQMSYIAITILSTVIAPVASLPLLPPAAHMWGWGTAALLSIAGWVIGSQVAFELARRYGRTLVTRLTAIQDFEIFEHYFNREHLFWTVVLLRITLPVDVLSYALGLFSNISRTQFFFSTLIGVTPFAFIFAFVGTLSVWVQLFVLVEIGALLLAFQVVHSRAHLRKVLATLLFITAATLAWWYRNEILALVASLETYRAMYPFFAALLLISLKTIAAPLGFPGTPLTLLSGSLFGPWWGTLLALIGNTLGSITAFTLSRFLFKEYAQSLMSRFPRIREFEERLESKPFPTVILLRLIPLFPYNALNFLLGATRIPLSTYTIASFIGMIPGTFVFVYFGGALTALSPINIVLSISGIIVLIVIGNYYAKKQ